MSRSFLDDYVARFNEGVRRGDFSRLVELYADDGALVFDGVPVGPFVGRDAIAAAYRAQPPDDEIHILEAEEPQDDLLRAAFAWSRGGTGRLVAELRQGSILRLTVSFDRAADVP